MRHAGSSRLFTQVLNLPCSLPFRDRSIGMAEHLTKSDGNSRPYLFLSSLWTVLLKENLKHINKTSGGKGRWQPEKQLWRQEIPGHIIWPRVTTTRSTETSECRAWVWLGTRGLLSKELSVAGELGHGFGLRGRSTQEKTPGTMGNMGKQDDCRTRNAYDRCVLSSKRSIRL